MTTSACWPPGAIAAFPCSNDDTARLVAQKLVRLAFSSVAHFAIVPLQDLLGSGDEARMNRPGRSEGNWQWRYAPGSINGDVRGHLRDITILQHVKFVMKAGVVYKQP